MKEASAQKRSYLAGLIDGEGCISIHRTHSLRYSNLFVLNLRVCIKMTNKQGIELAQEYYGGTINIKRRFAKNPNWSDIYEWELRANKAERFIRSIYPFLRVKKEHGKIALEFRKLYKKHSSPNKIKTLEGILTKDMVTIRENYYNKMKELNKRGGRLISLP